MKAGYIIRDQGKIHFITATIVEGLVAIEIVDTPVIDVLKKATITKYNQY